MLSELNRNVQDGISGAFRTVPMFILSLVWCRKEADIVNLVKLVIQKRLFTKLFLRIYKETKNYMKTHLHVIHMILVTTKMAYIQTNTSKIMANQNNQINSQRLLLNLSNLLCFHSFIHSFIFCHLVCSVVCFIIPNTF